MPDQAHIPTEADTIEAQIAAIKLGFDRRQSTHGETGAEAAGTAVETILGPESGVPLIFIRLPLRVRHFILSSADPLKYIYCIYDETNRLGDS
jgi:hypothetical protein